MKLIEFTRGRNIFKTLKIGKRVEIENWFKTWAPNVEYEIDDDLNIRIKRSLNFYGIKITSLPDNLYIEGYLDLKNTNITSLPDNLHIEIYLDIRRTKIISLPDNLHVEGKIYKYF